MSEAMRQDPGPQNSSELNVGRAATVFVAAFLLLFTFSPPIRSSESTLSRQKSDPAARRTSPSTKEVSITNLDSKGMRGLLGRGGTPRSGPLMLFLFYTACQP
ncbi:MAG: hypothetical protein ACREDR_34785, partial [Blastocatellia bacterium]